MATTVEPTSTAVRADTAASETNAWYRDPRWIIGGVAAIGVAAAAMWFASVSGKRKEEFAGRALSQARAAAESGNLPLASSELQRIIQNYKGADAAYEAVITLNQVRLVNNQGELAIVGLREFIASNPPVKYKAPAYGLLAGALESAKKPADAADAYRKASEAADVDYLRAEYLVSAGRAFHDAGKNEDAIKAYREVTEKFPKASAKTEAMVRLAELTDGKL